MNSNRKRCLRVLGWIFLAILIFLIIICASIFIQTKTNPDKIPSIFGFKPFVVLSDSADANLSKGDLVVIKDVNLNSLKKDDVIAFKNNDNYVVVRHIAEIDGEKITVKDSGSIEVIDSDIIEGEYAYKLSGFGDLVLVMQEPLTLFILLIVILIIGTLWIIFGNNKLSIKEKTELEKLRKEKKKDND